MIPTSRRSFITGLVSFVTALALTFLTFCALAFFLLMGAVFFDLHWIVGVVYVLFLLSCAWLASQDSGR